MTEEEVQAFCANNGISVSPVGKPLHVVDPTELPASVREFVNDDGTYKGDDTPEAEGSEPEEGAESGASKMASKVPAKARSKAAKKDKK